MMCSRAVSNLLPGNSRMEPAEVNSKTFNRIGNVIDAILRS